MPDDFTPEERAILARHFSNVDGPVFALTALPDTVKGALFSRYSRSPKALRRLFLDEFYQEELAAGAATASSDTALGLGRAEELYERVLVEYGDDSVAQLVGAHVAIEDASNVLTKVVEWGRLMAYLEQSTRYIPYSTQRDGRWRYHTPREVIDAGLRERFEASMDACFETYAALFDRTEAHLRERFPRGELDTKTAYRLSIRAKACDVLRGLLPAATTANIGLYGSAQAFEQLLLRLQGHPLAEARETGERVLAELRKVIPVFMRRIDREDRGLAWSRYIHETAPATGEQVAATIPPDFLSARDGGDSGAYVRLTEFDADADAKVVAAAIYPHADVSDEDALRIARGMSEEQRAAVLRAYVGERTNRRHKPGRAFERVSYRFDIVVDYGAFRDLQRHRMLTLDWQPLSPRLGYEVPEEVVAIGAEDDFRRIMSECAALYDELRAASVNALAAQYAVPMAYRIRFYMQMNAREAMHLIELRSAPQGHRSYRRVAQEMLREIRDRAGHAAIADAMIFADMSDAPDRLERIAAENAKAARLAAFDS